MTMVRKQVYIKPEQERKLKRLAKKLGVTEAEVLRRCLDDMAEEGREETPEDSWLELLEFMQERARKVPGSTVKWRREDSYYGERFD
jgi:hypothetical protein